MNVLPSLLNYGEPCASEPTGSENVTFVAEPLMHTSASCAPSIICNTNPCPVILNATCVFYEGSNLIYTGINTNDNLQTALQKIDEAISQFESSGGTYVVTSTTLTINGVTYDLSASRTWSVGTITTLNGLSGAIQHFATDTIGTDFNISSVLDTHTFNLPTASAVNRGALSSGDWVVFNNKQNAITLTTTGTSGAATFIGNTLNIPQYQGAIVNPVTGTGSTGQVAFWNSSTSITGNSTLYWDTFNGRLGVGNPSPARTLDVLGSFTVNGSNISITNTIADGSITIGNNNYFNFNSNAKFRGTSGSFQFQDGSGINKVVLATAGGHSYIDTGGNLTIGGTTDTGERLQVQGSTFLNGNVTFSSSTGMFWDATNFRLGIGTSSPASSLHIVGTFPNFILERYSSDITPSVIRGRKARGTVIAPQPVISGDNLISVFGDGFNGTNFNTNASSLTFTATETHTPTASGTKATISVTPNGTLGSIVRFAIEQNGNVLINTPTDLGQRLQVNGDTFMKGSGNTSATTALTVQNSDGTNMFRFRNDGIFLLGSNASGALVFPSNASGLLDIAGLNTTFYTSVTTQNFGIGAFHFWGTTLTATSGFNTQVSITRQFAPTSGTAQMTYLQINPVINQVGATGITRGLYINPTLTAVADWRSIQWDNNTGWGLFGAGTATNFLQGPLTIGEQTIGTNILNVRSNLTGATIYNSVRVSSLALSDVTNTATAFRSELGTQNATFTLGILAHFQARQGSLGASSTVTNQFGFWAVAGMQGATNNFGFYGDIASGTGRWNLYMNGTADNYLAGSLGVGTTSLTGYGIHAGKNITGAAISYGIYQSGAVQSDVTSLGVGFENQANIQAGVAANAYHHFRATQNTFGAGATLAFQAGFFVTSTLTGATNNYGFYGNVPSGVGRWNIFMIGAAPNYFNGVVTIGTSTPSASAKVQIDSTTQGFLPPRMTAAERTAIATPAEGLIIYQTDGTKGLYLYDGASWRAITII